MVSNMDKLLQGCGITEVSKMEAETFSQDLERGVEEDSGSVIQEENNEITLNTHL